MAGYLGATTADQLPYAAIGFLENMLIERMTSDNRTDCASANGNPNITTTAYTRTMAACQVLQEQGLPYNTTITTYNFVITNDVAYPSF